MGIFILFGVLNIFLTFSLLRRIVPKAGLRESILWFLLWNAALCWIYAEGASLFNGLSYTSARVFWGGVLLTEAVFFARLRAPVPLFIERIDYYLGRLTSEPLARRILVMSGIILLPLLLLAVCTPPNNFDSNHYHMHRILAWVHFENLDFFPTLHVQQLYHNVFAEYMVLSVYLVTGSDQLVNLVQYVFGLGCLAALTLVAKQVGLNRRGQLLAAFVLLTLPVGIFEFTTTQVDYVLSFFFTSFLYFGYRLRSGFSWTMLWGMSLSLSFAAFTKYPAFFYALPFCIYFGISYLRRFRLGDTVRVAVTAAFLLGLVYAPFWSRNYQLFDNIVSPAEGTPLFAEKLQADTHNFRFSVSSILKNSSLHLGLPYTGFNRMLENAILGIHEAIGVDVNEPQISRDEFSVRFSVHEDMVPNSTHFYLLIVCTLALLVGKGNRELKIFWLLGICGFFIFCTLLKFQLWSTRTHLPFFVMGSVLIGATLSHFKNAFVSLVLLVLFVPALFFVFGNPSKPVLPLPYYAKRFTAHVPSAICKLSPRELTSYRHLLGGHYTPRSKMEDCLELGDFPGYSERRNIFRSLDSLGYYDPIKKTVLNTPRAELYYINDKEKYDFFKPFFSEIKGEHPGVAVISHQGEGFYFYQGSLRAATNVNADFDYAFFRKEYSVLKNAARQFCYQYVVTDDPQLVRRYIPAERIERIVGGGKLFLVCLKQKECGKFLY